MYSSPFGDGTISLRLYPHNLPATARLDELAAQAALAVACGFDGVMLSERHGGAWDQIPNPLLASGFLLAAMDTGWAAPAPLLLNLRPPGIVAEDVAWLGARYPGRVGVGFGSGGNEVDFALTGAPFATRAADFARSLAHVTAILRGVEPHGTDTAIVAAKESIPLLSMAMSHTAARRAAALDLGIMGSSLNSLAYTRAVARTYRAAGGTGPHVLIRRVWIGEPPRELIQRQLGHYREAAGRASAAFADTDELIASDDPAAIAAALARTLADSDASALNIRVHVPGVMPGQAREQIERIGREVIPQVRARAFT